MLGEPHLAVADPAALVLLGVEDAVGQVAVCRTPARGFPMNVHIERLGALDLGGPLLEGDEGAGVAVNEAEFSVNLGHKDGRECCSPSCQA